MSIVEVVDHAETDDGDYVVLIGKIGRVEYRISVEDGLRGQRVEVSANGERAELVL